MKRETSRPDGRTALVTGGGYGIGRAAALGLAEDDWRVVVVDRNSDHAHRVAAEIVEAGGLGCAVVGDVTEATTAAAAVAEANRRYGAVTGLVTCAAWRHTGRITEITETYWDQTIAVILKGVFLFCKAVVPDMIASGGGTIVNVSSPDSYGRKAMVAYSAAKGAVNSLSACLAADHLHDGIRVNVVMPGFTLTGMTEHYDETRLRQIADRSVAKRPAMPSDIAGLIRFLMSPAAETFTGGVFGAGMLSDR